MSYFQESRQPVYSAALVFPFILVYEVGLLLLRSDVINGGDAVLLNLGGPLFRLMGFHASFASVIVLVLAFVYWQIRQRGSWKIAPPVMLAMFFESLMYALLLFVMLVYLVQFLPAPPRREVSAVYPEDAGLVEAESRKSGTASRKAEPGRLKSEVESRKPGPPAAPLGKMATGARVRNLPETRDFVLFCGAGVYEELVFRVFLLGLLMLVFTKLLYMEHAYAAAWSVLAGALIFSGFHHINGEHFAWGVFIQRAFAGLFFSAVYYNRCFGIAAASHALYDILVGLNQWRG